MMCKRNIVFFLQQFVEPAKPPNFAFLLHRQMIRTFGIILAICLTVVSASAEDAMVGGITNLTSPNFDIVSGNTQSDRLWVVSTRHLSSNICRSMANVPNLSVGSLNTCGRVTNSSLVNLLDSRMLGRSIVVYVHGNRMEPAKAIERALSVYRSTRIHCNSAPVDWIVFSWPSEIQSRFNVIDDFRKKAVRSDVDGVYLAWLLKVLISTQIASAESEPGKPIRLHTDQTKLTMIGYSYGARVIAGGLHALAGGSVNGHRMRTVPVYGVNASVGLVAPAVSASWLSYNGRRRSAVHNMSELTVLYNPRDICLNQFWRLSGTRFDDPLGLTGGTRFGNRFDSQTIAFRAVNCQRSVKTQHKEIKYYSDSTRAGLEMARLINHENKSWQTMVKEKANTKSDTTTRPGPSKDVPKVSLLLMAP